MLRAQYIGMSLATVICECSLGVNTEYRANLVQTRVNVPITLLHIYQVCQYKLFLISEGWEGFTEPSKPSLEFHWSGNQ